MKRILSLFLILVLMLSTLASCNLFNQGGEEAVKEADIKEAIKQLKDMYEDYDGAEIPDGTELVAQVKIGKTVFTIEWTASTEKVTFELVDGLYVLKSEKVTENEEYTITANVKSAGGQSDSISFKPILSAASGFGMITNPVAGVAYKLALLHRNEGGVVYFDGGNYNSYAWYLSYTNDSMAAVDVYLEEVEGVEGAYRLYFDKEGEKTYIRAYPRDGDTTKGTLELTTTVPAEHWTYSTEYNTLVYTSTTGEQFYIGSSGTYKSISCSAISYITSDTSYPCRLYGAGGVVEELPEMQLPTIPEDYTSQDVVEALYKLQPGQTIETPYEITGVITSIKYAYDPSYNNISVVIVVDGMSNKPVLCYRLTGGEGLKVGDTITVFAGLTNYGGTYETTQGGIIRNVVPGTGETPNPGTPDTNTAEEILNALYGLADGETLTGSYTLTGKITALDNYNNPTIVVDGYENMPVYCYRLVVDKAVGDTITVTATTMKNYGGTYEFMNCTLVEEGGNEGGNEGGTTTPTDSVVLDLTGNANLVSGSASQNIFAANGITLTMDKASSTSDLVVQDSFAQRFYAGSTITIEYPGMTKIVITLDDYQSGKYLVGFDGMTVEGATITRENDVVTIVFDAPTDVFTSANFAKQARCEKIEVFTGEVEGGGNQGGNEGGDEGGDEGGNEGGTTTPTYTAPVAGQAYDFFMELPTGKVYFAGSMSGDYLATTTDESAAVAIYFEEVTGGYHIYFMDGETKTYITAAAYLKSNGYAGCHFSLTTETPTLAWTYNTTYGIIEIYDEIEGKSDTFFAGTYGTYSTFSLSGQYYRDQIASGTQYPGRIDAKQ